MQIISKLNLSSINKESKLYELIKKLNSNDCYSDTEILSESIMEFDWNNDYPNKVCDCNSGHLCADRLQVIIDFINTNFIER